jgi:hypothetical protein
MFPLVFLLGHLLKALRTSGFLIMLAGKHSRASQETMRSQRKSALFLHGSCYFMGFGGTGV